jgi:hypothetical protein
MEHLHAALDPRKQELLEARFLGARVSVLLPVIFLSDNNGLFVHLFGSESGIISFSSSQVSAQEKKNF